MEIIKTETAKRYEIGDRVIYRAEGICEITDIRVEAFAGGEKSEYYILSPQNDPNSTVYVPVNNERLTSMIRHILSESEIHELIAERKSERLAWISDSRARNTYFKEILSICDRRDVIVLLQTVRDKIAQNDAEGKKSGTTETNAMYRASRLLRDEFSPAISLRSDEALFALIDGE